MSEAPGWVGRAPNLAMTSQAPEPREAVHVPGKFPHGSGESLLWGAEGLGQPRLC